MTHSSNSKIPVIEDYTKAVTPPGTPEGGVRLRNSSSSKFSPDRPVISIITAVLNGETTVEQTVLSVLNQTYDNVEYIVIDGGSTDRTIDILKKYDDKITYWSSLPDRGLYDAMNRGIAHSSGTLINFLNADDYLEPETAGLIAHKYRELNGPSIIYGNAFAVDEARSVKAKMSSSLKYWLGMSINHQTMFVHRDLFNTVGLFNIQHKLAADYDFLVRCFEHDINFSGLNDCIVNFRNTGISARDYSYRHEANLINKKYFGSLSWKRTAFVIFNYLWMPFKLNLRTLLYNTIGVNITRRAIGVYKKITCRS